MKVGLLVQTNMWFCPYVNIYIALLKQWNVDYDIIFWNRDHKSGEEGIPYNGKVSKGRFGKLAGYWNYGRFLVRTIQEKQYDRLIVFSPQIGIFISKFLEKHYRGRYIYDYRDLSIEQYGFLRRPFERLLDNSYANVISSPGFKKYLPKRDYLISHNFIISEVEKGLEANGKPYSAANAEVLTIGSIRDYESNSKVVAALSNQPNLSIRFVGRGDASPLLDKYAQTLGTKNIAFEGYYKKEDEPAYIKKATFLNIFYPDWKSHATALSNRFYNSLIYRRPMIVTKGQIQGDYAEQYNVGIAVDDPSRLASQLKEWLDTTDFQAYQLRCIDLLKLFLNDYAVFKAKLADFVQVDAINRGGYNQLVYSLLPLISRHAALAERRAA